VRLPRKPFSRVAIVATIRHRRPGLADRLASSDPRGAIVLGWSGMRGLITLATAFALPQQFPGRDLIVVLGTLVIQGFTLRPLMRLLRFENDGAVERELSRARVAVQDELHVPPPKKAHRCALLHVPR
jgi:monovalent cation/hydrogen antiporter